MVKRLLNATASEVLAMTKEELKISIYASEGRTVLAETAVPLTPIVDGITNMEIASFAGADLILLNAFDVLNPKITGVDASIENPIQYVRELTGRPIGANLEPINAEAEGMDDREEIANGRTVTIENLKAANELGLDFICLTGNPGTGVDNQGILKAISLAKEHFSGLVIAGKMHSSGMDEPVVTEAIAQEFLQAGVDILLVPAVYTVPGFRFPELCAIVDTVKEFNKGRDIADKTLVLSAIGTSQESSDPAVIREIALKGKEAGVDIQHIGDAGFSGLALPENIDVLGNTIRGVRHQLRMRAKSVKR